MDKLSRIAVEAKRNGLSYGQLMAKRYEQDLIAGVDHEKLREESREKRMREEGYVQCANELCGKMFKPRNKCNRYCCRECADIGWKRDNPDKIRRYKKRSRGGCSEQT